RKQKPRVTLAALAHPGLFSDAAARLVLSTSIRIARRVLSLFVGSLRIEWRGDVFLRNGLRVVIVAAGLHGLLILGHGPRAIAARVESIAAFDARPRVDPFRLAAGSVERRLEVIQGELPILLFEVNQTQVVVNPGVVAIELQRRLELLLRFGILAVLEKLNATARDDRDLQIVGHAQNLVVRIDFRADRLAV